jgi:phenylacetate-CoA ligase
VAHARDNVPFYQRRLTGLPDPYSYDQVHDLLDDLPVLTRADLQQYREDLRYRRTGEDPGAYLENVTSGSTGQPVTVLKHGPTYVVDFDATTLLDWRWHDRPLDATVVMFRVVAQDGDGPIGPPLSYLGHNAMSHWRSIVNHSPAEMVDVLHRYSPDIVFCNGVVLRQICLEQMHSDRPGIHIGRFVTVSDRIDSDLRHLTKRAFGAVVEDRYSTEEVGYVALQCPEHQHLHVMGDSLLIEVVDDAGLPCMPGESGRLLVTTLQARAQPLLRYEIGDLATPGEPCDEVVWPVLQRVDGRLRDGVTMADGSFHMVTFHGSALLTSLEVRDYLCAKFDNAIVVLVRPAASLTLELAARIRSEVSAAFALDLPVTVRELAADVVLRTWKRREWYRGIGDFSDAMSDEQVWAALAR